MCKKVFVLATKWVVRKTNILTFKMTDKVKMLLIALTKNTPEVTGNMTNTIFIILRHQKRNLHHLIAFLIDVDKKIVFLNNFASHVRCIYIFQVSCRNTKRFFFLYN